MFQMTQDIGVARLALSVSSALRTDLFAVQQSAVTFPDRLCLAATLQPKQARLPLTPLKAPLVLGVPVVPGVPVKPGVPVVLGVPVCFLIYSILEKID